MLAGANFLGHTELILWNLCFQCRMSSTLFLKVSENPIPWRLILAWKQISFHLFKSWWEEMYGNAIPFLKLTVHPWKSMVGRWISFGDNLLSGDILVSGRVYTVNDRKPAPGNMFFYLSICSCFSFQAFFEHYLQQIFFAKKQRLQY